MKVLIVGAEGMLGSALVRQFKGEEVVAWDKKDMDITNGSEVREKIASQQPKVVINAAAYTDVDGAEKDVDQAYLINETGVRNLAQAIKNLDCVMVHYSTDYVFSGGNKEGYLENDPPGPAINKYGASKLAGERVLKEVGPKFYLVRTAWLYGGSGRNFVDTMLTMAENNDTLRVVDDQYGSPTYTKDVAKATKEILSREMELGAYHCVNKGVATWYELAIEIFKIAEVNADVVPVSSDEYQRPAARPKYSVLRDTKGLGMREWKTALADYIISQ